MTNEHYVDEPNLSVAWARAVQIASATGRKEAGPLVVSITGFDASGEFSEDATIRTEVDALLSSEGMQSVETVSNTIFPTSLWNPLLPRARLFERYQRIVPRLKRATHKNRRGLYFERMISGGPPGRENQIDFVLSTYARGHVRRSVLQVAIFDPRQDHSAAALLGFPCLQHVTFAPIDGGLCVNAFYATQFMIERAYGNYVGICRLGRFIAHQLNLPLVQATCFVGIAECEVVKRKLVNLRSAVDRILCAETRTGVET